MLNNNASSTLSKKFHKRFFNSLKIQQEFQVIENPNSINSFSQINKPEKDNIINE